MTSDDHHLGMESLPLFATSRRIVRDRFPMISAVAFFAFCPAILLHAWEMQGTRPGIVRTCGILIIFLLVAVGMVLSIILSDEMLTHEEGSIAAVMKRVLKCVARVFVHVLGFALMINFINMLEPDALVMQLWSPGVVHPALQDVTANGPWWTYTGLLFMLILLGIMVFFFPGRGVFHAEAAVLRNLSDTRALRYSDRLLKGNGIRVSGFSVIVSMFGLFCFVTMPFLYTSVHSVFDIMVFVGASVLGASCLCALLVAVTVEFRNLERRKGLYGDDPATRARIDWMAEHDGDIEPGREFRI